MFIEVGPGKVLCGLLKQIDPAQKSLNVEDAASLEKTLGGASRRLSVTLENLIAFEVARRYGPRYSSSSGGAKSSVWSLG